MDTLALVVSISFGLFVVVMFFITWCKIFEKGGENGWAIFVPFYNAYILGKVAGGVNFGIWVLIAAIMNLFGFIIALLIEADDNATDSIAAIIIFILAYCFAILPWLIIRFIIAFKLGGKFGCGVGFRVFLALPYINAFPLLYLALSKNCVYREKPKEASVGLFVAIVLLIFIIIPSSALAIGALAKVMGSRFVATRTDAQVATARSDIASAQKAIVAKVFADNIDSTKSKAPNGESWGEWIMEVAGLDKNRWKSFGTNGVYPISPQTNNACFNESELPLLWINPRGGYMHFNPNKLTDGSETIKDFCENLRYSYESSGGAGNKIVLLESSGVVEF